MLTLTLISSHTLIAFLILHSLLNEFPASAPAPSTPASYIPQDREGEGGTRLLHFHTPLPRLPTQGMVRMMGSALNWEPHLISHHSSLSPSASFCSSDLPSMLQTQELGDYSSSPASALSQGLWCSLPCFLQAPLKHHLMREAFLTSQKLNEGPSLPSSSPLALLISKAPTIW